MDIEDIRRDLGGEQQALDDVVAELSSDQWTIATPSPRWTIAHQIAHLAYFDHTAVIAITEPETFSDVAAELWAAAGAGEKAVDELTLAPLIELGAEGLLDRWRTNRNHLASAAARLNEDARVPWYGPSMGARSFLTARLMEVWAHGQDIVDALGVRRPATDRIRHVAQLGFITRGWSFANRGRLPPSAEVRLALTAPSGARWTWGSEGAPDSVIGLAEEFCLVVTQRRHLDDTALEVTGQGARDWLLAAQAFAGPPTDGPPAGRF